ncbi:MAG: SDR family oxidoreductase [Burkholderiaceae bacterium]|nr:SDR family oxidoreductase [Burkholderiaceae bacterium]
MSRVALITGASRNIGRAIALSLAREGYAIACLARDAAALEETAALVREVGASVSVHLGDVSDEGVLNDFVSEASRAHGGVDVVVNNAGIMPEARTAELSVQRFRDAIEVNLVAQYALARAAHPSMRARGGGVVINIGSMFGAMGVPGAAAYCASKAAVEGLTRALAAEWARDGIRVVCVAPGYILSEISRDVLDDPDLSRRIVSRIPLRRVGQPREIGELVAFLVSEKAAFITGETIVVDGGQRMSI